MVEPAIPEPGIQEISEAYAVGRLAADVAATLGTWSQPPDVAELAALSHAERLHRLQRWLVDSGALRTEIPIADLASRLAVFQGNHDALRTYRPQPTEVAVSLACAEINRESNEFWRRLAGRMIDITTFPGNHYMILRKPVVTAVARWLRDRLADTDGEA